MLPHKQRYIEKDKKHDKSCFFHMFSNEIFIKNLHFAGAAESALSAHGVAQIVDFFKICDIAGGNHKLSDAFFVGNGLRLV